MRAGCSRPGEGAGSTPKYQFGCHRDHRLQRHRYRHEHGAGSGMNQGTADPLARGKGTRWVSQTTAGVNTAHTQAAPTGNRREDLPTASSLLRLRLPPPGSRRRRKAEQGPPRKGSSPPSGPESPRGGARCAAMPFGAAGGEVDMAPHTIRWEPSRPTLRENRGPTNECGMSNRLRGTEPYFDGTGGRRNGAASAARFRTTWVTEGRRRSRAAPTQGVPTDQDALSSSSCCRRSHTTAASSGSSSLFPICFVPF